MRRSARTHATLPLGVERYWRIMARTSRRSSSVGFLRMKKRSASWNWPSSTRDRSITGRRATFAFATGVDVATGRDTGTDVGAGVATVAAGVLATAGERCRRTLAAGGGGPTP